MIPGNLKSLLDFFQMIFLKSIPGRERGDDLIRQGSKDEAGTDQETSGTSKGTVEVGKDYRVKPPLPDLTHSWSQFTETQNSCQTPREHTRAPHPAPAVTHVIKRDFAFLGESKISLT